VRLTYFRGAPPNFGDELNTWLWPRLLPGFLDDDGATLFLGIGSIIDSSYDRAAVKIVFGTGFVPQYRSKPDVHDGTWRICFVRGPRTAAALDLPPDGAVGDSAILLRTVVDLRAKPATGPVSFIPHFRSLAPGHWAEACRLAGIRLIDPTRPVPEVIDALLGSRLVIAEAMHGAIVADALRTPWIPVLPLNPLHRDKWLDWGDSLGLSLRRGRLWPSTLAEMERVVARRPALAAACRSLKASALAASADRALGHIAAHRLAQLAQRPPFLSADRAIGRATERMQEHLEALRRDHDRRGSVRERHPEPDYEPKGLRLCQ
jgi:succinoglycan biosynthesis protein ExoV